MKQAGIISIGGVLMVSVTCVMAAAPRVTNIIPPSGSTAAVLTDATYYRSTGRSTAWMPAICSSMARPQRRSMVRAQRTRFLFHSQPTAPCRFGLLPTVRSPPPSARRPLRSDLAVLGLHVAGRDSTGRRRGASSARQHIAAVFPSRSHVHGSHHRSQGGGLVTQWPACDERVRSVRRPVCVSILATGSGGVSLAWAAAQNIRDLAAQPNRFSGAGGWSYTVSANLPAPNVVITEFLAGNVNGLRDESGATQDWIEIQNRGYARANARMVAERSAERSCAMDFSGCDRWGRGVSGRFRLRFGSQRHGGWLEVAHELQAEQRRRLSGIVQRRVTAAGRERIRAELSGAAQRLLVRLGPIESVALLPHANARRGQRDQQHHWSRRTAGVQRRAGFL